MPEDSRVVFITGAGAGLGRELALAFGACAYHVAVAGIAGTRETATEINRRGGKAVDFPLDLREPRQVETTVAGALSSLGRIDVLVNNAAVEGPTAPLAQVSPLEWSDTLAVNLTGAFLCDRVVAPHMSARGSGSIIHIASVAGLQAYPWRSAYAVSKWGLIGLTQTLAAELGPSNVRVNAVCPGPVEGERIERIIVQRARAEGRDPASVRMEYEQHSALGRLVNPQDVVSLVLYLASDAAASITGQAIRVCGGYKL